MSNRYADYPAGKLNGDVLNSFGVTKDANGNLVKITGMEICIHHLISDVEHPLINKQKIPDNWYKRAISDKYGTTYL
jgi:hypothetical protein